VSFSHAELGALRAVRRALGDVDVVIIGAAALRQLANFHWRTTYDLDLTVALDEDAYPSALVGSQELKQDIRLQHRWYAAGVSLDILPAGPSLREQGWIRWGEHRMSLAGLGLAFEHAITVALAPDLVVRVAPPAVIAVLKMIAYCERPAERERDLHDLSHLLDEYLGSDDDRRFDDRVLAAQLPWDHVSAHELGHDIGRIISASDKQAIDTFLDRALTGDVVGTLPRMLRGPTVDYDEREERLRARLDAFAVGLRGAWQP
jgi:predicted nucleotidyltransferase